MTKVASIKRHGVTVRPGSGDRVSQDPETLDPRLPSKFTNGTWDPLRFKSGTLGPRLNLKSGTPGPLSKFRSETREWDFTIH